MHVKHYLLAAACAAAFVTPASHAQSGAVATVNGVAIPQARAQLIEKSRVSQGQKSGPELEKAIRDFLINREIVAQAAAKKGLEKQPDVATQLDLARQEVLVAAYLQDFLKNNPVSDAAVQAEYNQRKAQVSGTEYKASHILVDSDAKAKQIIDQLAKGGNFAQLARENSKDPSKDKGGDLGWNVPTAFVQPFSEAMTKLKKGETTKQPVKSQFGWHVIRVEDTRTAQAPAFDQVKDQLKQAMQLQTLEKHVQELKSKAAIK